MAPVGVDDEVLVLAVDDSANTILEGTFTESASETNPKANINPEMLYQLLQTSIKKIDSLQNYISRLDDHIIKLDAEIHNLHVKSSIKLKTIEMTKLKPFGLPAESEADLEKLESNLKNDDEFTEKLVSSFINENVC